MYATSSACTTTVILQFKANVFFGLFCIAIENQAPLLDESIQHAKAAVMLDIKDGNSWCKLLQFN